MVNNNTNRQKGIDDTVVEVSFSPNKPVELRVGSSVSRVQSGRTVRINEHPEFVHRVDKGVLETYSYDGPNKIVEKRWSVNLGVLTGNLVSSEVYKRKKGSVNGLSFNVLSDYLRNQGFSYR
jgi:hypothetical protein